MNLFKYGYSKRIFTSCDSFFLLLHMQTARILFPATSAVMSSRDVVISAVIIISR